MAIKPIIYQEARTQIKVEKMNNHTKIVYLTKPPQLNTLRIKNFFIIHLCLGFCLLTGCASISTEIVDPNGIGAGDGIVYYMPNRPIRLKVNIAEHTDKTKRKIEVSIVDNRTYDLIPDLSQQYLLRYNKSWVSRNKMYVSVNKFGLLSVTHGNSVSRVNDILKNIAQDAAFASLGAGAFPTGTNNDAIEVTDPTQKLAPPDRSGSVTSENQSIIVPVISGDNTCEPTDQNFLIFPEKLKTEAYCGVSISLTPVNKIDSLKNSKRYKEHNVDILEQIVEGTPAFFNDLAHVEFDSGKTHIGRKLPGLFYKQEIPYFITMKYGQKEFNNLIAYSPNQSKVFFAPIRKTLFTENVNDIALEDGVISSFEETTDSEILGITKLPANIISSYTDAVGKTIGGIASTQGSQQTLITNDSKLDFALEKSKQCQTALAAISLGTTTEEKAKLFESAKSVCDQP